MNKQVINLLGIIVLIMVFSVNFVYGQAQKITPEPAKDTIKQEISNDNKAGELISKEQPEEKITTARLEISGVISSISKTFIAIETGIDSKGQAATEMAFNLDKGVIVVHKKNLSEIKVRDTVAVVYEETMEKRDDGRKIRKTKVKTITFIKPAPKEMTAQEQTLPSQESKSQDGKPLSAEGKER